MQKYKPGESSPKTGTFKMVDDKGKTINKVDVQKGQSFPPCPKSSCHYEENSGKEL